jgi:hypothetical protein
VQFFPQADLGIFVVPLTDSSNPYIVDTNLGEAAGLLQNKCSWIASRYHIVAASEIVRKVIMLSSALHDIT